MNKDHDPKPHMQQTQLINLAEQLRPELHRYCSRLMGSVIEGEDVVQDTLARALLVIDKIQDFQMLRAWLFRIAHNRALDLLRSRAIRITEAVDSVTDDIEDINTSDPMEMLMREETIKMAVSRFMQLPVLQRSVIILKDVLDEPLVDIATLLNLSVDSVKAHLSLGRARLREINITTEEAQIARPTSDAVANYVKLFNLRDWNGLKALLSDDVKLSQSTHPVRVGAADVSMFFGAYAKNDHIWLVPAWLGDREVIALFENRIDIKPSYIMWLEWQEGKISFIRDYRYVRYVAADAELILTPNK
ncbi:sigma-70 family RNA polymerase sigma factor [Acinetobacter guillouiae]|uniref:sigma-70 family RNA polymerase sigma factor n=1 Tax=Acinetobacter guillouiae TaxID=106649 RepID=UPI0026E3FC24|nr:sigma-70 family RNA polymerase sigma factor [Acinetobacter guillouiae]MDO6642706.1 sigma-70 family RNA polymerase sigma factor [Acinetobacter guillouiae]